VTAVPFADTATSDSASAEDVKLVRYTLDAFAKSVSETCGFRDCCGDFVIRDGYKCLGVRVGTGKPGRWVL
jgi:hypothetical protein